MKRPVAVMVSLCVAVGGLGALAGWLAGRPSLPPPVPFARLDFSALAAEDLWFPPPAQTDATIDVAQTWATDVDYKTTDGTRVRWKWGASIQNRWKEPRAVWVWCFVARGRTAVAWDLLSMDMGVGELRDVQGGLWAPVASVDGAAVYYVAGPH